MVRWGFRKNETLRTHPRDAFLKWRMTHALSNESICELVVRKWQVRANAELSSKFESNGFWAANRWTTLHDHYHPMPRERRGQGRSLWYSTSPGRTTRRSTARGHSELWEGWTVNRRRCLRTGLTHKTVLHTSGVLQVHYSILDEKNSYLHHNKEEHSVVS